MAKKKSTKKSKKKDSERGERVLVSKSIADVHKDMTTEEKD